jgi:hypothetical protein
VVESSRLYSTNSHLWFEEVEQDSEACVTKGEGSTSKDAEDRRYTEQRSEAADRKRTLVKVGLTERGVDDIGNVLRWVAPREDHSVGIPAGAELLKVEWDAYTITAADELYHTVWDNVSGSATFTTPVACSLVRINDNALAQAVVMGAMPCPETTWLMEVSLEPWTMEESTAPGGALVGKAEYEARVRGAPPGRFVETEF